MGKGKRKKTLPRQPPAPHGSLPPHVFQMGGGGGKMIRFSRKGKRKKGLHLQARKRGDFH